MRPKRRSDNEDKKLVMTNFFAEKPLEKSECRIGNSSQNGCHLLVANPALRGRSKAADTAKRGRTFKCGHDTDDIASVAASSGHTA